MGKSKLLFSLKRRIVTLAGTELVVEMDLFEVESSPLGLFLEKYRLSWIAFDAANPLLRVLMDCHPPQGLHYHVDEGPQQTVECKTVPEALKMFQAKVEERFGELGDPIYENIYF